MSRIEKAVILTGCLFFLGCLALFAYAGTFTRYWADDYCYSAVVKQYGLWGGIVDWYIYSGNRFSAIASVAVLDLLGPRNVAFLPVFLLAFWVLAWTYFLTRVFHSLLHWQVGRLWLYLLAIVQVFFVVFLAPDRLQTIYWRMGMLHYALPLPVLLVLLGWTAGRFCQVNRRGIRGQVWTLLASAAAAFFAGGQSETYAMLQIGVLGLGLLAGLLFLQGARRVRAAWWLGVPLLSSLAVVIVMFLSPSLSSRLAVMPAPTNLWLVVPTTLRYVSDFIFYSIRGQITPYVVYMLIITAITLASFHDNRLAPDIHPLTPRATVVGMALSLVLTFVLIAFTFTPSAYANLQYPAGRALMPASFTLLTGLASFAFFFSTAVQHLRFPVRQPQLRFAALLLLLGLSLYPLRAARIPLEEIRQQSVRAARWDTRDAQIHQAMTAGVLDIMVKQVEVVHTLEDLGPDPRHWINHCASIYYGVRSISANP